MRRSSKLAVILHADVVGSTTLVQLDEDLAHERIQDAFRRFGDTITKYQGRVRELRGDALLAEFERASDAVTASLAFQAEQVELIAQLNDTILPMVRVGNAMGEVIVADNTVTGAGVVLAQRVEQLAEPGGVCITGAIHEAPFARNPYAQNPLQVTALCLTGVIAICGIIDTIRAMVSVGEWVALEHEKGHGAHVVLNHTQDWDVLFEHAEETGTPKHAKSQDKEGRRHQDDAGDEFADGVPLEMCAMRRETMRCRQLL